VDGIAIRNRSGQRQELLCQLPNKVGKGCNVKAVAFSGAVVEAGGEHGTCFSVWAPKAREVSMIDSFNHRAERAHLYSLAEGKFFFDLNLSS